METLAAYVMRHGAFGEADAVGWVVRLAKSVEASHACGRPHGKLSAACIVMDDPAPTSKALLASTDDATEDLAFQSPERLAGAGPSPADDTWALAAILYLALTGRLPFLPSEDGRVRHDERPERLWEFQEKSDLLQDILDRAFERDVSKRIRSVAALRSELERAFDASGVGALAALEQPPHATGAAAAPTEEPNAGSPPPPLQQVVAPVEARANVLASAAINGAVSPAARPISVPMDGATPPRRRPMPIVLAIAVSAAVAGTFVVLRARTASDDPLARAPLPAPTALVPNANAAVSASSAAASASSAPQATAVTDVNACMRPLFAEGSFDQGVDVDFAFVCTETDPRAGSVRVIKQVVRAAANRTISDGMREWGTLGWHDMAAFAVIRVHCCAAPPPLSLPPSTGACPSLAKVLNTLGTTAAAAAGPDDPPLQAAAREYGRTVRCLVKNNGTQFFKRHTPPADNEAPTFQKTLARLFATSSRPRP